MVNLKKIFLVKFLALIVAFLILQGDISVYAKKDDYKLQFAQAKQAFLSGNFKQATDSLERIHRIGRLLGDFNDDDKSFLARVYLLLGAAYEKLEEFEAAGKNYALSKNLQENVVIEGIDLSSLIEFQRIILGKNLPPQKKSKKIIEKSVLKKKKKFPWLLVVGGVVVVGVVLALLLKKKDSDSGTDPNFDTETLGIEWVDIPAGEFQMGDNFNDNTQNENEKPVHAVYLDQYYVSRYEITFTQYDLFCDETGRVKANDNGWGRENRPVIQVSWNDANDFCEWLARKTGKNIHLCTEAQWEKAARGTDQRRYPWGNATPDCNLVNFSGCENKTREVGSHPSGISSYGVHDMAGNVKEWCQDIFDYAYYAISPYENPTGPDTGNYNTNRGGAWNNLAIRLRSAARFRSDPGTKNNEIGFRICWE